MPNEPVKGISVYCMEQQFINSNRTLLAKIMPIYAHCNC